MAGSERKPPNDGALNSLQGPCLCLQCGFYLDIEDNVTSTFQPAGRRKARERNALSLEGQFPDNSHIPFLVECHVPELSYRATSNSKGSWRGGPGQGVRCPRPGRGGGGHWGTACGFCLVNNWSVRLMAFRALSGHLPSLVRLMGPARILCTLILRN